MSKSNCKHFGNKVWYFLTGKLVPSPADYPALEEHSDASDDKQRSQIFGSLRRLFRGSSTRRRKSGNRNSTTDSDCPSTTSSLRDSTSPSDQNLMSSTPSSSIGKSAPTSHPTSTSPSERNKMSATPLSGILDSTSPGDRNLISVSARNSMPPSERNSMTTTARDSTPPTYGNVTALPSSSKSQSHYNRESPQANDESRKHD